MDLALLILRLTVGLLVAGHGAQKLFRWFGGGGPEQTAGWLASIGFRPGHVWAWLSGGSEFFGGVSLALGFLSPLGSIAVSASMLMAIWKVHWPKVWASNGGFELPLAYLAVAVAVAITGPGLYALDTYLGIVVPGIITIVAIIIALVLWTVGFVGSSTSTQPSGTRPSTH